MARPMPDLGNERMEGGERCRMEDRCQIFFFKGNERSF
jgi:hypothetical protein